MRSKNDLFIPPKRVQRMKTTEKYLLRLPSRSSIVLPDTVAMVDSCVNMSECGMMRVVYIGKLLVDASTEQ